MRFLTRVWCAGAAMAFAFTAGCASHGLAGGVAAKGATPAGSTPRLATAAPPAERIDAVILMVAPTALNLDDVPGPDGVQVRVFFFRLDQPQSLQLTAGAIDFLLYEGRVSQAQVAERAPFHAWSYTPADLAPFQGQGDPGWAYELALNWGSRPPAASTVTLIARYRPPSGAPVYSAPTLFPMGQL